MTLTREQTRGTDGSPDAGGPGLEVDVLFAEARQRARRRRVFLALAIVATVLIVGAAGIFVFRPSSAPAGNAAGGVQALPPAATTTGRLMVEYDGGTLAHPGGLEVIDPATGKTVRTLVRNPKDSTGTVPLWATQLGLQVTNDGKTVYFVEGASSSVDPTRSRPLHLRSMSTAGGPVREIGLGTEPAVSPDGTMVAYQPLTGASNNWGNFETSDLIALFDTRTGVTRTVRIPGMAREQPHTMLWLSDSSTLVVHLSDVLAMVPGVALHLPDNGPVIDSKLTPKTLELDASTLAFRTLAAATTRALEPTRARDVTMEWAGGSGDLVQVLARNSRLGAPQFGKLGTIDLDSGAIHWDYALPGDRALGGRVQPVADPGSWDNLVLVNMGGNDESWSEWSPGKAAPKRLFGKHGRQFSFLGLAISS